MTVYVDTMQANFKYKNNHYKMSHMIADTEEELHSFAQSLGLKREWYQDQSKHKHYDISQSIKKKAIENGAIEVSQKTLAKLSKRKIVEGHCGSLKDIDQWFKNYCKNKK
tara:strand:+ start:746 stop:1075 length:330 start_codon:yes stop_codon:yes gene_type:complete